MGGSMLSLPERVAEIQDVAREGWSWVVQNRWAVAGVILGGGIVYWGVTRPRNLPPGPRGLPILGNMFELTGDTHLDCVRLREKYGDIFCLKILGTRYVYLCDFDLIREAFLKNDEALAYRVVPKCFTLAGLNDEVFTAPYGDKWKADKKFAMTTLRAFGFGTEKGEDFLHDQLDQFGEYLYKHGNKNIDMRKFFEKMSTNILFAINFSKTWSFDDPELTDVIVQITNWMEGLAAEDGALGLFPEIISRLFLPLEVRKQRKNRDNYLSIIKKLVDERIRTFDADNRVNVVDEYLHARGKDQAAVTILSHNTFSFTVDGVNTLNALLAYVVYYLAKYPDVQEMVQKQLDDVIGSGRPITMKDRESLPLLNAAVYEAARVAAPFPVVGSMEIQKPLQIGGFTLPRGAVVISSVYCVHRDKKIYATPDEFNINHFLNKDGSFKESEHWMPFSIGRRMCIGDQHAKMSLFDFIGNLLLRYKIEFTGEIPEENEKRNNILTLSPNDYRVNLIER